MRRYGLTIGISGAPIEVVAPLGSYLMFHASYGTEVDAANGRYTDTLTRNLVLQESKQQVVDALLADDSIDPAQSFAFGDTEQDAVVLEHVGHPVALNPDQELRSIAQQHDWTIIDHDEDVVQRVKTLLRSKTTHH
jgi:phosphoserine phosphatase